MKEHTYLTRSQNANSTYPPFKPYAVILRPRRRLYRLRDNREVVQSFLDLGHTGIRADIPSAD